MENETAHKKELQERILQRIDFTREFEDEEIWDIILDELILYSRQVSISISQREELGRDLFYSIRKLDILQELLDDTRITEIMINGTDSIFVEREGVFSKWNNHFDTMEKLEDIIQQMVGKCNRVVNEASPIVDARLENGSRLHVVLPPVALNGPIVTIRRFPDKAIQMDDLIAYGSISNEVAKWLEKLVKAGYNIFISGGTGSGKTTFLNALSQFIPKDERVITIEDSAELQIQGIENLVSLETRNANIEGCKEITIRDLIKASLRMHPTRIVVGEIRGSEAIDMIQSLNTGHDGSLSTGHANSARDMLSRLETMILMGMDLPLAAIRKQIASGLDIIVHLGKLRDKTRKVLEIVEVLGYENGEILTNPLFVFEEEREENGKVIGRLVQREELLYVDKLKAAGIDIR
ncbi:MAG: CpaF family protein [Lachnospiraceae bacterium]|nr:CpaF family protein [Lachnospiraceae bacterium]